MKTINEAAEKFEKENGERIYYSNVLKPNTTLSIESFKAGVEFAQRWYSVKEELPETRCKKHSDIETIRFIVKSSGNEFLCFRKYRKFDGYCFVSTETMNEIINVTNWRPIELK